MTKKPPDPFPQSEEEFRCSSYRNALNVVPADALESCGLWAREVQPRVEFAGWYTPEPEPGVKCKHVQYPDGSVTSKCGVEGKIKWQIPF